MGTLFHPTYPVPVPAYAVHTTKDGKPHVRVTVRGKPQVFPLSADGKKYIKTNRKWYGQYVDADGNPQKVPLSRDRAVALQMLAKLEHKAERQKFGLHDRAEDHAQQPLAEHLNDYKDILKSKGDSDDHVKLTAERVGIVVNECRFMFPRDVQSSKVAKWLANRLRGTEPKELEAGRESFRPAEVVELLGITPAGVRAAMKALRLTAAGQGKARRYPRTTVEALIARSARGNSPQTVNRLAAN